MAAYSAYICLSRLLEFLRLSPAAVSVKYWATVSVSSARGQHQRGTPTPQREVTARHGSVYQLF